jgi:hypothetical protein
MLNQVLAGHRKLDESYGKDWIFDIDDSMDMKSVTNDVLAQLYGSYDAGLDELNLDEGETLGFCAMSDGDFPKLQKMQEDQIDILRKERE